MLSETSFEHNCFRRLFSLTLYKNKKIPLGEMSFSKDFVHDTHGDLYPVLEKCGQAEETVADGLYRLTGDSDASVTRLCGAFFPYATYEICLLSLEGTAGFCFIKPDGTVFEVSFGKRHVFGESNRFCRFLCAGYALFCHLPHQARGYLLLQAGRRDTIFPNTDGAKFRGYRP